MWSFNSQKPQFNLEQGQGETRPSLRILSHTNHSHQLVTQMTLPWSKWPEAPMLETFSCLSVHQLVSQQRHDLSPQYVSQPTPWHKAPNSGDRGFPLYTKQQRSNQGPTRSESKHRITVTKNWGVFPFKFKTFITFYIPYTHSKITINHFSPCPF